MNPVMEESPFFLQLTNDGVPRGATGFFVGVVGFVFGGATFSIGRGGEGRGGVDEEGTEAFLGARKYLMKQKMGYIMIKIYNRKSRVIRKRFVLT